MELINNFFQSMIFSRFGPLDELCSIVLIDTDGDVLLIFTRSFQLIKNKFYIFLSQLCRQLHLNLSILAQLRLLHRRLVLGELRSHLL